MVSSKLAHIPALLFSDGSMELEFLNTSKAFVF